MLLFASPFLTSYFIILSLLLGLVMGSALNCLAFRLARGEKWSGGRSRCPSCGSTLGIGDLIPLFSYIFLRGRCRRCGEKISLRYPVSEAVLALLYLLILLKYDLSLETIELIVFASCLFCLSLVDLDIQEIPDRFHIISASARLVFLLLSFGFTGDFLIALGRALLGGLILGGGVLILSLVMDRLLHKESLGGGDIKLLFVLGMYFSLPCCCLLIFMAAIIGIVLALCLGAKKGVAFPFGPALSVSAFLTLLFGEKLISLYMGLLA